MAGEIWPPPGWPPPIDPSLMGAPPMAPGPMDAPWPPPEYIAMMQAQQPPPPPVDPVAQANAELLAQPLPAPPPPADWAPSGWMADAAPAPAPQAEPGPPPPQAPQQAPRAPGYAGQVQETGTLQEESMLREGDVRAKQADIRAQGMETAALTAMNYDQQAQQRAAERKADLDQRWKTLEADRAELAAAKIDPQKFYKDMSTNDRIAWAGMAFLGGVMGVKNGSGRNSVMEQVNRLVDADIDAQKANIGNRQQNLKDGQSLYRELVAKYGDEEQAAGMLKAAALDRVAKDFEAQAMQWENPAIKEKALQAAAEARQQATAVAYKTATDAEQRAFENKIQKGQLGVQQYNAKTGRMNVEADADAAKKKAEMEWAKLSREQQQSAILDPEGKPIIDKTGKVLLAPDPKVALEERKKQTAAYALYQSATEYENLLKEADREFGGAAGIIGRSDVLARLDQMHGDMMVVYKNAEGMGALDAGSIMIFNKVMPPPSTWTKSTNPVPGVRQFRDTWRTRKNNEMRQTYGYTGNWVDDYEEKVPFNKGATQGKGNRQGMTYEPPARGDDEVPFTPIGPQGPARPQGIGPY